MSQPIHMLGFYVEDGKIVIVQPYTGEDGHTETIEHLASNGDELWEAFRAIAADPGEPPTVEHAPQPSRVTNPIARAGLEHAEALITRAAGPLMGSIAGSVIRNPAGAKAAAKQALDAISQVSWPTGERKARSGRW